MKTRARALGKTGEVESLAQGRKTRAIALGKTGQHEWLAQRRKTRAIALGKTGEVESLAQGRKTRAIALGKTGQHEWLAQRRKTRAIALGKTGEVESLAQGRNTRFFLTELTQLTKFRQGQRCRLSCLGAGSSDVELHSACVAGEGNNFKSPAGDSLAFFPVTDRLLVASGASNPLA